jgi:hypothetical protein
MGYRKGPWLAGALPDTWTAWTPGRLISKTKDLGHGQPHCFFGKVTTFCARSVSGVSNPSRCSGLGSESSLRNSMMRLRVGLVSLPNPRPARLRSGQRPHCRWTTESHWRPVDNPPAVCVEFDRPIFLIPEIDVNLTAVSSNAQMHFVLVVGSVNGGCAQGLNGGFHRPRCRRALFLAKEFVPQQRGKLVSPQR